MKVSGQTIINYFAENFLFLEDLFKSAKKDNFFIQNEILFNRCEAEYEKTGKVINIKKLEDYKIVKPLADGHYEFNKRFIDFISFLIDDFRLDLPESIKKYQNSISQIYSQITLDNLTISKQKNTNQIIDTINGLIKEIQEFDLQIEANTTQLFVETSLLKANKDKIDYENRIKKATELIENYIKPLNYILNKEHSDSFIKLLSKISDFANLHRHEQKDIGLQKQFQRLYQRISNINENILKHSSIMAKDITPLIDRLRNESHILKGVEIFLLNARKNNQKENVVKLYEIKGKRSRSVYSKNFDLSAKSVLELLKKEEQFFVSNDLSDDKIITWIFNKDFYRQKLFNDLPIDNFFEWCYKTLYSEIKADIDIEKFYYMASLLFENNLQAEFLDMPKFNLSLSDYILKVPIVRLNLSINE